MKVSFGGTETVFRGIPWLRGLLSGFQLVLLLLLLFHFHTKIQLYFTGVPRKFGFSHNGSTDIKSSKASGVDRYIECRTTFGR